MSGESLPEDGLAIGKVYRINSPDETYYIGSTHQDIDLRLGQHKQAAKHLMTHTRTYDHFHENGWDDLTIEVLWSGLCDTSQLRYEEEKILIQHLGKPLCLNQQHACARSAELQAAWRATEEGKEELRRKLERKYDNRKEYDRTHPENKKACKKRWDAKNRVLIECECGKIVIMGYIAQHRATRGHKMSLARLRIMTIAEEACVEESSNPDTEICCRS